VQDSHRDRLRAVQHRVGHQLGHHLLDVLDQVGGLAGE
jgi:hypothetical protein